MGSEPMETAESTQTPFRFYEDRLTTFGLNKLFQINISWLKQDFIIPELAIKSSVFLCGIGFSKWEKIDIPLNEHYKHSRSCPFLKIIGYNPVENTSSRSTDFTSASQLASTVSSGFTFSGKPISYTNTVRSGFTGGSLFANTHN